MAWVWPILKAGDVNGSIHRMGHRASSFDCNPSSRETDDPPPRRGRLAWTDSFRPSAGRHGVAIDCKFRRSIDENARTANFEPFGRSGRIGPKKPALGNFGTVLVPVIDWTSLAMPIQRSGQFYDSCPPGHPRSSSRTGRPARPDAARRVSHAEFVSGPS